VPAKRPQEKDEVKSRKKRRSEGKGLSATPTIKKDARKELIATEKGNLKKDRRQGYMNKSLCHSLQDAMPWKVIQKEKKRTRKKKGRGGRRTQGQFCCTKGTCKAKVHSKKGGGET